MTDSRQLLAEYARNGSEAAFRELVTRYVDPVYSAAIRLVDGDAHRAQDVTQTVFADLARMAGSVSREAMVGGWLHRHTCFVAANLMRGERRRQARERQAAQMNASQENPEMDWMLIAPILDEAINELGKADRMAVLLRFFEQRDFQSVGEALGSNEDAARMRVNRALEKLRTGLKRRGVTTGAAGLATVLAVGVVESAPAGLVATISAAASVAGSAAGISTVIAATKTIAMTTLQKTIIGAAFAAAIGTGIIQAHQAAKLRAQNQTLQQQRDDAEKRLALSTKPALHLAALPTHVTLHTNAAVKKTNLYGRLLNGEEVKLTAAQVEAYLKANRTNAASLLAAYRTSGDPALLQEAMEKFPNNPQVALEAVLEQNLAPEEQRQWLNRFEQDAPNNALANYLSALNYFNSDQTDQGLQELAAASGKSLDDYTANRMENDNEAYLAAGYSAANAEELGAEVALPQLNQLKQLAQDCSALANAYRQDGDTTSAQGVLQVAYNMGQQYANPAGPESTISQLVGCLIETIALRDMDPNAPYGDNGQTVQDQLNQITQQEKDIHQVYNQVQPLFPMMSDQDWVSYENRAMLSGELSAWQWVVNKYGQQ